MKKQIVYSFKVAGILVRQGFEVVDKQPNLENLNLDVFFFERTPELEAALDEAIKSLRK